MTRGEKLLYKLVNHEKRKAIFEDYDLARNAQKLLIKQGFFVVIDRFYDGPALVLVQVVWL